MFKLIQNYKFKRLNKWIEEDARREEIQNYERRVINQIKRR